MSSKSRAAKSSASNEFPEEIRKVKKIVDEMRARPDAVPFLEPVDWEGYGLFDYPQIVKEPMDLGTINKRILAGEYKTAQDCARDVRLVWTNCMTYNQDGSDFFILAKKLAQQFEDKFNKAFKDATLLPPEDPRSLTISEKTEFSSNLYEISSEELGAIVKTLQERCPSALSKSTSPEGLEINIDAIDEKTFRDLEKFVSSCMGGSKKSRKRPIDDGESSSKKGKKKK